MVKGGDLERGERESAGSINTPQSSAVSVDSADSEVDPIQLEMDQGSDMTEMETMLSMMNSMRAKIEQLEQENRQMKEKTDRVLGAQPSENTERVLGVQLSESTERLLGIQPSENTDRVLGVQPSEGKTVKLETDINDEYREAISQSGNHQMITAIGQLTEIVAALGAKAMRKKEEGGPYFKSDFKLRLNMPVYKDRANYLRFKREFKRQIRSYSVANQVAQTDSSINLWMEAQRYIQDDPNSVVNSQVYVILSEMFVIAFTIEELRLIHAFSHGLSIIQFLDERHQDELAELKDKMERKLQGIDPMTESNHLDVVDRVMVGLNDVYWEDDLWKHQSRIITSIFRQVKAYSFELRNQGFFNREEWTIDIWHKKVRDLKYYLEANQIQVKTTWTQSTAGQQETSVNVIDTYNRSSNPRTFMFKCWHCGMKGHPYFKCPKEPNLKEMEELDKRAATEATSKGQPLSFRLKERLASYQNKGETLTQKVEEKHASKGNAKVRFAGKENENSVNLLDSSMEYDLEDGIFSVTEGEDMNGVIARYDNAADVGRVPSTEGLEDVSMHVVRGSLSDPQRLPHGYIRYIISGISANGTPETRLHRQRVVVQPGLPVLFSQGQLAAEFKIIATRTEQDSHGDPCKEIHTCADGFQFETILTEHVGGGNVRGRRSHIIIQRQSDVSEILAVDDGTDIERVMHIHRLFGHISSSQLKQVLKAHYPGEQLSVYDLDTRNCHGCAYNKKGLPHPIPRGTTPFELVHIDFHKLSVPTPRGEGYVMLFQDSCLAQGSFAQLLRSRSKPAQAIILFCSWVENRYGKKVKRIYGDQEFRHASIRANVLQAVGVHVITNIGYDPRSNLSETLAYHLQRMAGAWAMDRRLPLSLAGYLMVAASNVRRQLPTSTGVIAEAALGLPSSEIITPSFIPGAHVVVHCRPEFRRKYLSKLEFHHAVFATVLCEDMDHPGSYFCRLWCLPESQSVHLFRRTAIRVIDQSVFDHPSSLISPSTVPLLALTWTPPSDSICTSSSGESRVSDHVHTDLPMSVLPDGTVPEGLVTDEELHPEVYHDPPSGKGENEPQDREDQTGNDSFADVNSPGNGRYVYIQPQPDTTNTNPGMYSRPQVTDTGLYEHRTRHGRRYLQYPQFDPNMSWAYVQGPTPFTVPRETVHTGMPYINSVNNVSEGNNGDAEGIPRGPRALRRAMTHTNRKWAKCAQAEWAGMCKEGRVRILSPEEYEEIKTAGKGDRLLELGMVTWVFDIKVDGRYKGRICFRGDIFKRKFGDVMDHFASSTSTRDTIRLLFCMAAILGLEISLLDITQAFLSVSREEVGQHPLYIRMEIPDGDYGVKMVILEMKANIYGDTMAGGAFQKILNKQIKQTYFQSAVEPTLFRGSIDGDRALFCTVVDDILRVSDPTHGNIDTLIARLQERFTLKVEHNNERFCGVSFKRCKEGIFIYQEDIILKALKSFGWDCELHDAPKPKKTPMSEPLHPPIKSGEEVPSGLRILNADEHAKYRATLGVLLFLDYTRIDVQYALRQLSRHIQHPTDAALKAMGRVLRYLYDTRTWGILYKRMHEGHRMEMEVYVDSSHASQVDSQSTRSMSGVIVLVNGMPIGWSCKKQVLTCMSSAESEVVAMSEGVILGKSISMLLDFACGIREGLQVVKPIIIHSDNTAAITLVRDRLGPTARTRHFAIRQDICRDWIQSGDANVDHVGSRNNLADFLTKPQEANLFIEQRGRLMKDYTDLTLIEMAAVDKEVHEAASRWFGA